LKRSIFIDMKTIKFLDKEMKEKLCKVPELNEFIRSVEIRKDIAGKDFKNIDSPFFNSSQITNLGVFRFYAESYLKNHQDVDKSQTILIKHRQIEGNGLPLQFYLFTKNNQFVPYENLQSEIVEHFLAIMSEFGLRVFQQPTGDDLQPILNK